MLKWNFKPTTCLPFIRDSTVTIHPLKMRGSIQDLELAKRRATQLKPEKIRIDELSYQPEKLYTVALLEGFSETITEETNTTLKNECMACFDPEVQVHSCYLNNPRERVNRNFDNAFQLVDLLLANETIFEKIKNKVQVEVKDKDLHLTRSDLLRNVFFMDRLKAALMKLVF